MPTAAGARALLSATSTSSSACRRLPRVAAHASPSACPAAAAAVAVRYALPCSRRPAPAPAARGFHTSPPARSTRPGEPNAATPSPQPQPQPQPPLSPPTPSSANSNKEDNSTAANDSQPSESPAQTAPSAAASEADADADVDADADAAARRERLKSAGYGSARARAARSNRVDEAPAVELPEWFLNQQVSLYEQRPLGMREALLAPLRGEEREETLSALEAAFGNVALTEDAVARWIDKLRPFYDDGHPLSWDVEAVLRDCQTIHHLAFWQTLLLVYRFGVEREHMERLRQHFLSSGLQRKVFWSLLENNLPTLPRRWLENVRLDAVPGSEMLHLSPLAKRCNVEYAVCMELLAAVRSQLTAPAPGPNRQESRRPPIVVSMLDGKGRSVAASIIHNIATDLRADTISLDAHSLARLLGPHLGQNHYSARGTLAMLGYAAAEMNGRLAPRPDPNRPDPDADQEFGVVAVTLPRLRSFLSPRQGSSSNPFDSRWEELKVGAVLDKIVAVPGPRREALRPEPLPPGAEVEDRPLIIHLHDYVELNSLYPSIVMKLRTAAERLWAAGKRVVLVGSSFCDSDKPWLWRDQLLDLGRDGAHVIPLQVGRTADNKVCEEQDAFYENMHNIEDMLRAVVGEHVPITINDHFFPARGRTVPEELHERLFEVLRRDVYDVQWVYRLVSVMVGDREPPREGYTPAALSSAMKFISDRDSRWADAWPGVAPPYFSPLHTPRHSASPLPSPSPSSPFPLSFVSQDEPFGARGFSAGGLASRRYTSDERKLLSGLIDAKDIRTTFQDIIVPQETKESLIGLTSLSLTRPDAFSYGVLKTERIPGCLLYGPPGTGKTLLAKAVAKESGANMLEVSAASINDKWVGQSEKNVQALFSLARKLSPCVIFLDEADALLSARGGISSGRAAHREMITQFLREWDGLAEMRAFIMVATNRPFDLDEAVLRRLPRKILVDLPLAAEREAILRVLLRDESLAPDVDLRAVAAETDLYSGSDLKNLCVSAAMEAVREEVREKEAYERAAKAEAEAEATAEAKLGADAGADAAAGRPQARPRPRPPYVFPARRVLARRHFDHALAEIGASVSEDMASLKAIRKFDERYGDAAGRRGGPAARRRSARRALGFEVVPSRPGSEEARVRQVGAA